MGYRSSMRFNTRVITIASAILIICLGAYIIINAINSTPIDGGGWAGMGSFLTGIGIIVGGSYYSQQAQKKTELTFQRGMEYSEGKQESKKEEPAV